MQQHSGRNLAHPKRHAARGAAICFIAESLMFPTGLLTVAYLTRRFGPTTYGQFALASVIVAWVEWGVSSIFARATLKFVGEADDWRPAAGAAARLSLVAGVAAAVLLVIASYPIAIALQQPRLAQYLILFAVDVPLFALCQAHRNILIGVGRLGTRAGVSGARWIIRLVFVVALVKCGWSVEGAILGSIGASIVELALSRCVIRPRLLSASSFPIRKLLGYAAPLFVFAIAMRLFDKVDLILLTAITRSSELAGLYGAAQNLALVPAIFAMSLSPLVVTIVSQQLAANDVRGAAGFSRDAIRSILLMLPIAGIVAGSGQAIAVFCFGVSFAGSGPILSLLVFSAVGMAMISIATAILTAADRPALAMHLTAPLVPAAVVGHLLIIPHFGAAGAAGVQAALGTVGGLMTAQAALRDRGAAAPLGSVARCIAVMAGGYLAARAWPAERGWLMLKLPILALAAGVLLLLLGEFSRVEIEWLRSMVRLNRTPAAPKQAT